MGQGDPAESRQSAADPPDQPRLKGRFCVAEGCARKDMEVVARGQGDLRPPFLEELDQRILGGEARSLALTAGIEVADVFAEADDRHAVWYVALCRSAILH